jgi:hypothetical protein
MTEQNLFGLILYNLYDLFFDQIDQKALLAVAITSREINNLLTQSGGYAKSIRFDWKSTLPDFFNRLVIHTKIQKMEFNGGGMQLCILDILPFCPNMKTLVLKDTYNVNLVRDDTIPVTSQQLKRPRKRNKQPTALNDTPQQARAVVQVRSVEYKPNIWSNIKYIFIIDNNKRKFNIAVDNFPNLEFVGSYKCTVMFDQMVTTQPLPYIMDFKDHNSMMMMIKKNYTSLSIIVKQLKKIYN